MFSAGSSFLDIMDRVSQLDYTCLSEASRNACIDYTAHQVLSAFSDRSFTFEVHAPTTSFLLKQCAGIQKVCVLSSCLQFIFMARHPEGA